MSTPVPPPPPPVTPPSAGSPVPPPPPRPPNGAPRHNPFVGPRSIQYGERIYGRDREIGELRDLLTAERIVLMYSPSGAGKTSLINAGLRPELTRRDFSVLPTIRVGLDPAAGGDIRGTNRYLMSTLLSLEEGRPADRRFDLAELAYLTLEEYLGEISTEIEDGRDPCLVFDQFEELFTLDPTDEEDKLEFVRNHLGTALRNRNWWALMSMREDYVAHLDPYLKYVPSGFRNRYRLDLLRVAEAKSAAILAARSQGVDFTEEAASHLVEDLSMVRVERGGVPTDVPGPYVEPVQLQVVCRQLWIEMGL